MNCSDDNNYNMIRLREEADLLENTRLYNAEKRGIAQGKAEIIKIMLKDGRTVQEIAAILHISPEDVKNTQKNMLS